MATEQPTRRTSAPEDNRPVLAGVKVRPDDIEGTKGLSWVALLFRSMAGLLFLLMIVQLILGFTSTVELSYGVLFAEAVRLVIFAGLLWAAGDLADLFVKSHYDIRATRILVARIAYRMSGEAHRPPSDEEAEGARGRQDAGSRH